MLRFLLSLLCYLDTSSKMLKQVSFLICIFAFWSIAVFIAQNGSENWQSLSATRLNQWVGQIRRGADFRTAQALDEGKNFCYLFLFLLPAGHWTTVRGALPPSVAQRRKLRNGMSPVGAHPPLQRSSDLRWVDIHIEHCFTVTNPK